LSTSINKQHFLNGGGEMGELMRAKDWSQTPLGTPDLWSPSLRTIVSVVLNNPFGMFCLGRRVHTNLQR
jgi:hypothetical protein